MTGNVNLGIALNKLPDGTVEVQLLISAGSSERMKFSLSMSPTEAEATGKALRDIAIQAKTNLIVPNESLLS